jgi:hypothetical protein
MELGTRKIAQFSVTDHERRIVEQSPPIDHFFSGMADDRSARASPVSSSA